MFVVEHGSGASILAKNVDDLFEEFVARIFGLAPFALGIIAVLSDDEHGVHGQLCSTATQRLGHSRVNRKTKFFGALAAQVIFEKLIHIGRYDVERWTMPAAVAGIADEITFAHVPGMGKEAPFRRDDGHAFAAGGVAGERRDEPGGRGYA